MFITQSMAVWNWTPSEINEWDCQNTSPKDLQQQLPDWPIYNRWLLRKSNTRVWGKCLCWTGPARIRCSRGLNMAALAGGMYVARLYFHMRFNEVTHTHTHTRLHVEGHTRYGFTRRVIYLFFTVATLIKSVEFVHITRLQDEQTFTHQSNRASVWYFNMRT